MAAGGVTAVDDGVTAFGISAAVTVDVNVIASCIVAIDAAVGWSVPCHVLEVAAVVFVVLAVAVCPGSGSVGGAGGVEASPARSGGGRAAVGVGAVAGPVVVVDGFGQGVHAAFGGGAVVG